MSDSCRQVSVRQVLQAETRDLHLALHDLPVFRDLLGQRLTIERYWSLLERFYGFYLPLDAMLLRGIAQLADDVLPDPYQERAPYLREDLTRLARLNGSEAAPEELPCCTSLPVLRGDGDVLGALYVVEGSLLGGRVLNRKLDSLFGPDNDEGRRFFSWGAAQDSRLWTRFCEALERHGDSAGGAEGVVDAANQTFASMLAWLQAGEAMAFPTPDQPLTSLAGNA